MSDNATTLSVSAPVSCTTPQNAKSDEKVWNPAKGKFVPADPAKATAEEAAMDRSMNRTLIIFCCAGVAAALWFLAWLLTPNNDSIMSQMGAIEHGYLAVIAGGVLVLATSAVMRELKK